MKRFIWLTFVALQQQNEKRCDEEIEEIRRGFVGSGNTNLNTSLIRFSDEALDEQRHCIRIADEKIALAGQAYEMVFDSRSPSSFF